MYESVEVAAISYRPVKWDKAANADRMEELFVQAAQENPRMILTTEGALEGYIVMEIVEGRAPADSMLEVAEPIDGPYIRRFQKLARALKTCLAFGFAERIGDEAFNCAIFLDHEGEIRGRYHKVQLAEGTHPSWRFNRVGSRLRAFDTPIGRAGFVICNDRWNPDIVRALVLDGARIILIPSYGSKTKDQNQAVLARARENGVPIVEANVGMNLIISKGEICAYQWGNDQITHGVVDIPAAPCEKTARQAEQDYLAAQTPEMEKRYQRTLDRVERLTSA
ncbi:MAG: carbon-nitrogen hydrolase family protein [Caldilineaceae bacterium SB0661_bin_32]|uniref:Carbon-nitrogen hydrolase family protein n=1 Tax=Caldilineaceae bacterium SB0661_bin_32 TaxID=2605255 RepID=A0A6B1DC48_9CHLR|nr:carbon-nitrogen hydrolase family protein [Caldilineaceae bacterium SB0661_bin_32]